MQGDRPPKPLVSTRANDPEVEERLEAFVVGLGEALDELQDAEAERDWARLAERATAMAASAAQLGYAPVALVAEQIGIAAREAHGETAHKAVAEITELAKRVRRGHRSAA